MPGIIKPEWEVLSAERLSCPPPHSPIPTCQLPGYSWCTGCSDQGEDQLHGAAAMDRDNLQLEVDSLRYQASMERWSFSRCIVE